MDQNVLRVLRGGLAPSQSDKIKYKPKNKLFVDKLNKFDYVYNKYLINNNKVWPGVGLVKIFVACNKAGEFTL